MAVANVLLMGAAYLFFYRPRSDAPGSWKQVSMLVFAAFPGIFWEGIV